MRAGSMAVALPFLVACFLFSCAKQGEAQDRAEARARELARQRAERLSAILSGFPSDIGYALMSMPVDELVADADRFSAQAEPTLGVVDKRHALSPDAVPENLVSLNATGLTVTRNDLRVTRDALDAALRMSEAARKDGIELVFASSYRSFDYQARLWQRNVKELGEEKAARESAKPGQSQHQLGTVVDFSPITDSFANTPAGKWLSERAWEYGFSLSYPKGAEELTGYRFEPWHYRYIGVDAARSCRERFGGSQHWFLAFVAAWKAGESEKAAAAAER